ncbi:PAX-interacting protein 1-like [Cervus elaphus]|uniref:PAX-interacting protein 1-like n=1 Tax=Cervus elaphus TaxID=9860 RepID=UPI001CC27F85|nr:PAX-interacting protein 1-like [Cervus elaphus]
MPAPGSLGHLEPVTCGAPQRQALSEAVLSSFSDKQNYLLRDGEAEVLFSFSWEESLRRAHVSPLFKAKYFYITPGICPSLSTMKAIMECARGKVLSKQPSFQKFMEYKQDKVHRSETLLNASMPYAHNAEFVLTGVLTQTLDYESYKFN